MPISLYNVSDAELNITNEISFIAKRKWPKKKKRGSGNTLCIFFLPFKSYCYSQNSHCFSKKKIYIYI